LPIAFLNVVAPPLTPAELQALDRENTSCRTSYLWKNALTWTGGTLVAIAAGVTIGGAYATAINDAASKLAFGVSAGSLAALGGLFGSLAASFISRSPSEDACSSERGAGVSVHRPLELSSRSVIAMEGIAKRYGDRLAVAHTTLLVNDRTSLALVGPSGCGKSTILRLVLGLLTPDTGRIVVGGVVVAPATVIALRRRIGYVIQDGGLFPHLSAIDNVSLLARRLGWSANRIAPRVAELAALVRLDSGILRRYPGELSGGQRQRVGIMRALMLDPQLLLLDEPMGALDPIVRARLQDDLKRIFSALGKTVLFVTHSLDEAAYLGDQVALMRDGRVIQRGTLRELVDDPADSFVREFVQAQRAPCV
jgi:osmoprotectant transport system ATP-binding protein